MIIHASLQTDIAHYYSTWILQRLKQGFIDIPGNKYINRYNFNNISIEKIYFWSRDPLPLIKKLPELESLNYNYEIISEISLYDKFYEKNIKEKYKIINDLRKASNQIGRNKTSICYGPIFTTFNCSLEWHKAQFKFLCEELKNNIKKVYISFEISQNCLNAPNYGIEMLTEFDKETVKNEYKQIAESYGLEFDIRPELNSLNENELDIGEIDTCPAACMYCIGVRNKKSIKLKNKMHNSNSSLLIGNIKYDDKIKDIIIEKKEKTLYQEVSLFDFLS